MQREYGCTRNVLYIHDCIGHVDTTARQGYYIWASSQEEVWQKMAVRFSEPTSVEFKTLLFKSGKDLM